MRLKTVIKSAPCIILWLTFVMGSPETSHARYSGPMRFSVFLPCSSNESFCAPRILAEGTIEDDTAGMFSKFLIGKNKSPYNLPSKATVCFDSPGGTLLGGVNLGNTIRANGFNTCLESKYRRVKANSPSHEGEIFVRDAVCASACVLALAGGVNREFGANARVGVHQFSGTHPKGGDSKTTLLRDAAVAGYLEMMGVRRTLLDVASLYTANQVYWLSPREISQFRLATPSYPASKRR